MRNDAARVASVARRLALIQPFHVMEVMERAQHLEAAGRSVIHMEIGQPDFGAPPQAIEAAVAAMHSRTLGYTSTLGIGPLREAISGYYAQRYKVHVPSERIAITAGGSGAFVLAMGVLVNPGDEVLVPDPGYSCNPNFVRMFDGVPVGMPIDERQHYQPTLGDVRRLWGNRTRGVILASPSNPTGTIIAQEELARISRWVHAQGGFLIVDEIYQGLVYEDSSETALALDSPSWVVNSFSKYFGMTGWRLGWMVVPEEHLPNVERLAQNAFICPSAPAQHAALGAFHPDALAVSEARREELRKRRDYLVPALQDIGFTVATRPQGAFYIYAGCQAFCSDSSELAMRLLDTAGVAITPGVDFGSHRAQQHVRFAYTRSLVDLAEGVERLRKLLK
jgi:aspartate/methionine/tyrosine aminotransferase